MNCLPFALSYNGSHVENVQVPSHPKTSKSIYTHGNGQACYLLSIYLYKNRTIVKTNDLI